MAECGSLDIGCNLKEAGREAVATGLEDLANKMSEAVEQMVITVTAYWVYLPPPVISDEHGVTGFIKAYLGPWTFTAALCAVIIGAIKMAWDHRGEAGRELFWGLVQLAVIASFASTAISTIGRASTALSTGIVEASVRGGDMGENLLAMIALSGSPIGAVLTIIGGLIAVLAAGLQLILMLIRDAALPILAGCITLSAAFWTTDTGRAWFRRFVTLTVGFLAYQPAASIIYAAAFVRMGQDTIAGSRNAVDFAIALTNWAAGVGTFFLALAMMPALIGFVFPVAGSMAGRGGGGAVALGAMGGMVAQGAINNGSTQVHSPAPAPVMGGGGGGAGPGGPTGSVGPGGGAGPAGATAATGAAAASGGTTMIATKAVEGAGSVASNMKDNADSALGNGDQK